MERFIYNPSQVVDVSQLAENIRGVFWMISLNGTKLIYVSPAREEICLLPSEPEDYVFPSPPACLASPAFSYSYSWSGKGVIGYW